MENDDVAETSALDPLALVVLGLSICRWRAVCCDLRQGASSARAFLTEQRGSHERW
jgi:hypothetical protein